jgi:hypothetical protein
MFYWHVEPLRLYRGAMGSLNPVNVWHFDYSFPSFWLCIFLLRRYVTSECEINMGGWRSLKSGSSMLQILGRGREKERAKCFVRRLLFSSWTDWNMGESAAASTSFLIPVLCFSRERN